MGLFKKKEPVFNMERVEENKRKIRELFNQAVEDGDSYKVLYAHAMVSDYNAFTKVRTSTYTNYIFGYREEGYSIIVMSVDRDLTSVGMPRYIDIQTVKETNYYKKYGQAWLVYEDRKTYGYGTELQIDDQPSNTRYSTPDIKQEEEREAFLDFFEKYTEQLRAMGRKIKKWKR